MLIVLLMREGRENPIRVNGFIFHRLSEDKPDKQSEETKSRTS